MKKNMLIISLLITNFVTAILLYNSTKQDLFTLIKNKVDLELQNASKTKKNNAFHDKEEILNFYKPLEAHCGAAVSVAKQSRFAGTPMMDMACLIADKRKIIWTSTQDVADMLIKQILSFVYASKFENIKEIHGISYRPEGKRDALLFAKLNLIENTKNNPQYFGDYLIGTLLGYAPADITFFYQRWTFFSSLLKKENPSIKIPSSYANFSPELKKRFDAFIEQSWPNSEDRKRYLADITEANDWLKEQSAYSEKDLLEQITALEKNKPTQA